MLTARPKRRALPGRADQITRARDFTKRSLGSSPVADDAVLLVSELATNSLEHTMTGNGGQFEVTIYRDESSLLIGVTDPGRRAAGPDRCRRPPASAFPDARAGEAARGVSEVHWLLFWPEAPAGNPCWPDAAEEAEALMAACIRQLEDWAVTRQQAGGELPVPGVYGVPEQWPHIRALYQRAGFAHTGHTEIVYLARVDDLPRPAAVPIDGLAVRRPAGMNGTRLSAILGEDVIGYIEVETFDDGERLSRHGGWADIGNLRVTEPYRRRGVAASRRRCSGRPLTGCGWQTSTGFWTTPGSKAPTPAAGLCGLPRVPARSGIRELTRTRRGWTRTPQEG